MDWAELRLEVDPVDDWVAILDVCVEKKIGKSVKRNVSFEYRGS